MVGKKILKNSTFYVEKDMRLVFMMWNVRICGMAYESYKKRGTIQIFLSLVNSKFRKAE
jgi:hypothetical protein